MRLKTPPSKNKSIQKAYQNSTNRYKFIITFVCVVIVCDQWRRRFPRTTITGCVTRGVHILNLGDLWQRNYTLRYNFRLNPSYRLLYLINIQVRTQDNNENNPKEEGLTQSSSSPFLKYRACPTTGSKYH